MISIAATALLACNPLQNSTSNVIVNGRVTSEESDITNQNSGVDNNSELVEIDGDIYLVKYSGKVAVDETRAITAAKANGLVKAGTYYFGADGKLQK